MVARRVRIESTPKAEEGQTGSLLTKVIEEGEGDKGKIFVWIVIILLVLAGYHAFEAYKEQATMEEDQKKEGMNCMYQFRTEECNPMNLSDKCNELLQCVQRAEMDIDEMEVISNTIKKTSKSLSDTMLGPVALAFGVVLLTYLKKK